MPARRTAMSTALPACLLAGAALAAAGCNDNTSSAGVSPPALSKQQAGQVLAAYTTAVNQVGRRLDGKALPGIEADPQLSMDEAALKLRRVIGQKPPAMKFTHTVYYIPRLHGYPHWFAADAITGKGKQTLRHALLFTQAKAGAPWLLAADPYPADAALSKVALDPDGYATPVDTGDKGLAVAPARMAAAHAALLSGGPSAPGASALAKGPKTTETYDALKQGEQTLAKRGVTLSSTFAAAPYAVYALRTKDRGALVWYVVKQNEAYSAAKRGRLAVSGDLTGLAPATSARTRMDTTVLVQYLATVPPKGRATVTGMYRKAIAAHGS
ncbi:hypothetical protein [Actinomadura verrucosospora]|uniref:DUF8094 domain-containing protein n=1 Tax=Actinomadura verrucosospora TaxID=46165 RepID=A0A7D3VXU1_ACTVE|nr:hypothetical protein [Actinomadura verrucosospora]QKG25198.1 hypothetical protein ACTIVE_6849 [Actinomadura verrucosospora]